MEFSIVVVAYNKKVKDIRSIKEFLKFKRIHAGIRLIIYHNLTKECMDLGYESGVYMPSFFEINDFGNEETDVTSVSIEYHNNQGNMGLSRAYNKALRTIDCNSWIMWADDDTWFSLDYLLNLYANKETKKAELMGTVIWTDTGKKMTPGRVTRYFIPNYQMGTVLTSEGFINSGLCVKRSVYNIIGEYDENQFMNYVDILFFDKLRDRGMNGVLLVNGKVIQNFSKELKTDAKTIRKRHQVLMKDFGYYCKVRKKGRVYWLWHVGKEELRLLRASIKDLLARKRDAL